MMKVVLPFGLLIVCLVFAVLYVEMADSGPFLPGAIQTHADTDGPDKTSSRAQRTFSQRYSTSSASGCTDARDEAMHQAVETCEPMGGIHWYSYDSCALDGRGRSFMRLSYRCRRDG